MVCLRRRPKAGYRHKALSGRCKTKSCASWRTRRAARGRGRYIRSNFSLEWRVDLLSAVGTDGITIADESFPYSDQIAYKIAPDDADLSIGTSAVFPDGFPRDFSIVVTAKPQKNARATLLVVYSSSSEPLLRVEIGRNPLFVYNGLERSFLGVNLVSGEWVRFAFVVKDKTVSLYVDGELATTLDLSRADESIETTGSIMIGRSLGANDNYKARGPPSPPSPNSHRSCACENFFLFRVSFKTSSFPTTRMRRSFRPRRRDVDCVDRSRLFDLCQIKANSTKKRRAVHRDRYV